jgi:hypothetical protein
MKGIPDDVTLSTWKLRWDLASTQVLIWLAHPSEDRQLRPEVHLFLADRYGRLAQHHRRRGHLRQAATLDGRAEEHFRLGGGIEPPPAVSMAMPIPRPRVLVKAARGIQSSDPNDAA